MKVIIALLYLILMGCQSPFEFELFDDASLFSDLDEYDFNVNYSHNTQITLHNEENRNELHLASIQDNYEWAKAFLFMPGNHVYIDEVDCYGRLPIDYVHSCRMKNFFKIAYIYKEVIIRSDNGACRK